MDCKSGPRRDIDRLTAALFPEKTGPERGRKSSVFCLFCSKRANTPDFDIVLARFGQKGITILLDIKIK